jgi:hypothetical protein
MVRLEHLPLLPPITLQHAFRRHVSSLSLMAPPIDKLTVLP